MLRENQRYGMIGCTVTVHNRCLRSNWSMGVRRPQCYDGGQKGTLLRATGRTTRNKIPRVCYHGAARGTTTMMKSAAAADDDDDGSRSTMRRWKPPTIDVGSRSTMMNRRGRPIVFTRPRAMCGTATHARRSAIGEDPGARCGMFPVRRRNVRTFLSVNGRRNAYACACVPIGFPQTRYVFPTIVRCVPDRNC